MFLFFASLVTGYVTGVDMTDEQLEVYDLRAFSLSFSLSAAQQHTTHAHTHHIHKQWRTSRTARATPSCGRRSERCEGEAYLRQLMRFASVHLGRPRAQMKKLSPSERWRAQRLRLKLHRDSTSYEKSWVEFNHVVCTLSLIFSLFVLLICLRTCVFSLFSPCIYFMLFEYFRVEPISINTQTQTYTHTHTHTHLPPTRFCDLIASKKPLQ